MVRLTCSLIALVLVVIAPSCSTIATTSPSSSTDTAELRPAPRGPAATATPAPTRTPPAATRVDAVDDIDCPPEAANFAGQHLSDQRFGTDLTCANFVGATLTNVSFAATSLNGANFTGSTLTGVSFDSVSTRGADFTDSTFDGVEFEDADLSGAILQRTILISVIYESTVCPDGTSSDVSSSCGQ